MFRSFWPGRLSIALALLLGLSLTIHLGVGLTAACEPMGELRRSWLPGSR